MKFPRFSFPKLKEKFSSHISSFSSEKLPVIKDFLHYAGVPLLFALSFLAGSAARIVVHHFSPEAVATSSNSTSWGLSFQEEGKRPIGNASIEELDPYNAYFAKDTPEKKIFSGVCLILLSRVFLLYNVFCKAPRSFRWSQA